MLGVIAGTARGKTATHEQRLEVLAIVDKIEKASPPFSDLYENPAYHDLVDGWWHLQYTSPSFLGEEEEEVRDFPRLEHIVYTHTMLLPGRFSHTFLSLRTTNQQPVAQHAKEGDSNIPTERFDAKGSVSASGIKVDISNKKSSQLVDTKQMRVTNRLELGSYGYLTVAGAIRPSPNVNHRAIVSLDSASYVYSEWMYISFGFVFLILAYFRGSKDGAWFETTFVDEQLRITHGSKGTLFIQTREEDLLAP